jgi:hypothetical protein
MVRRERVSRPGNTGDGKLRADVARTPDNPHGLFRLYKERGDAGSHLPLIKAAFAEAALDVARRTDRQMNAGEPVVRFPAEARMEL